TELLHGGGAVITHAPPERQHDADDHEERGPHESVKDDESHRGMDGKRNRRESEYVNTIPVEIVRNGLKVDPAEYERKRDRCGDKTAPHDQPMRGPAPRATPKNKPIRDEFDREAPREFVQIGRDKARIQEYLPSTPPIHPRRRARQPHRIPV